MISFRSFPSKFRVFDKKREEMLYEPEKFVVQGDGMLRKVEKNDHSLTLEEAGDHYEVMWYIGKKIKLKNRFLKETL